MWDFEIMEEAERDLDKLDTKLQKRVVTKLRWLVDNFDHITPIPLGEPLRGFFKLRVGDWRIAYEVEDTKRLVTIHAIGRRDKIYKVLQQKRKR